MRCHTTISASNGPVRLSPMHTLFLSRDCQTVPAVPVSRVLVPCTNVEPGGHPSGTWARRACVLGGRRHDCPHRSPEQTFSCRERCSTGQGGNRGCRVTMSPHSACRHPPSTPGRHRLHLHLRTLRGHQVPQPEDTWRPRASQTSPSRRASSYLADIVRLRIGI